MDKGSERSVAAFALLSAFVILLSMFAFISFAGGTDEWDGDDGSTEGQIPIRSAADLALIGTDHTDDDGRAWTLGESYFLNNDIVMTGTHVPIGTLDDPFTGTFNGNKRSITGIDVNVTAADFVYAGIFGCTDGASIYGLRIDGSFIASMDDPFAGYADMRILLGSIAGFAQSTSIKDCRNAGTVTVYIPPEEYRYSPLVLYTGGLVGWASSSVMENCHNTGDVTAISTSYVFTGGIAGIAENTPVIGCSNTGNVTASGASTGGVQAAGIAGQYASVEADTTIEGCMNTGNVSALTTYYGRANAAGIVSDLFVYYGSAAMIGCANAGNVTATATSYVAVAGGAVAEVQMGDAEVWITDCSNTGNVTASADMGAVAVGLISTAMLWQGPLVIERCHNTGAVATSESTSSAAAGILGTMLTDSQVTIADCYNSGSITAGTAWETYIGGIFAQMITADVVLANCYNTGTLEEAAWVSTHIGGIGGWIMTWESAAYVANCYFIEKEPEIPMFGTTDGAVLLIDGEYPDIRPPEQSSGAKTQDAMSHAPGEAGSIYFTGTTTFGDMTIEGWDFGNVWTFDGGIVLIDRYSPSAGGTDGTDGPGPGSAGGDGTKGYASVPVLQVAFAALFAMLFIGCAFYGLRRNE